MEVLYYRDSLGNFGDDLNEVMWKQLLPPHVFDVRDVLLMGVGSIFNQQLAPLQKTSGKRVFVLGSGAGYGPLPIDWKEWRILAVRGPLTAELICRPETAVTDAAVLLRSLPQFRGKPGKRKSTLLIPHYRSVLNGRWDQVAKEAGMTFVDPRWSVSVVMDHFCSAELVITEAMHGAIVADTLRIPWLPILIAPDALPFKWVDWTLSVDLPYEPLRLRASSTWEALFHRTLARSAKMRGSVASALVDDLNTPASLIQDFKERYKTIPESGVIRRNGWSKRLRSAMRSVSETLDGNLIRQAAAQVKNLALSKPYLSRDDIFERKADQLYGAVQQLIREIS